MGTGPTFQAGTYKRINCLTWCGYVVPAQDATFLEYIDNNKSNSGENKGYADERETMTGPDVMYLTRSA